MGVGVTVDQMSKKCLCLIFSFYIAVFVGFMVAVGFYGPSALKLQKDGPITLKTPARALGAPTGEGEGAFLGAEPDDDEFLAGLDPVDNTRSLIVQPMWNKRVVFPESYDHFLSISVLLSHISDAHEQKGELVDVILTQEEGQPSKDDAGSPAPDVPGFGNFLANNVPPEGQIEVVDSLPEQQAEAAVPEVVKPRGAFSVASVEPQPPIVFASAELPAPLNEGPARELWSPPIKEISELPGKMVHQLEHRHCGSHRDKMHICHRVAFAAYLKAEKAPKGSRKTRYLGDKKTVPVLDRPMGTYQVKTVVCNVAKPLCEPLEVLRFHEMRDLNRNAYRVAFQLLNTTEELSWMGNDGYVELVHRNSEFALFEGATRLTCLILGLIAFILFISKTHVAPFADWASFQVGIAWLLVLLVGFNDPLYVANFFKRSTILSLVGLFFRVTFYCALAIFWLVGPGLVQNLQSRSEERPSKFKMFCLVFLATSLWFSATSYFVFVHHKTSMDPFFLFSDEIMTLWPLQAWLGVTMCIYMLWYTGSVVCTICPRWRTQLHPRTKIFFIFSLMVMFTSFVIVAVGGFHPIASSLWKFTLLHVLLNLHVIILSHLYSPTPSHSDQQETASLRYKHRQVIIDDLYDESESSDEDYDVPEPEKPKGSDKTGRGYNRRGFDVEL